MPTIVGTDKNKWTDGSVGFPNRNKTGFPLDTPDMGYS